MDRLAFLKRKVGGVPVLYIAAGVVAILAVYAWRAKVVPADAPADSETGDSENADAAESFPEIERFPSAAAPSPTVDVTPPDKTNEDWRRDAIGYLISQGASAGAAHDAIERYIDGESLSVEQGKLRDNAVRKLGLPPDVFRAGATATPAPKPAPKPAAPPVKVLPLPKPVVKKPAPAKPTSKTPQRTYTVKSGDTLTSIAAKYKVSVTALYEANRKVIGSNKNLIYPGQVYVIP
jgi:LysM repeat protein